MKENNIIDDMRLYHVKNIFDMMVEQEPKLDSEGIEIQNKNWNDFQKQMNELTSKEVTRMRKYVKSKGYVLQYLRSRDVWNYEKIIN